MGVRERLQLLRKVFGNAEPPEIAAAEEAAGMTPSRPFSPGEPIGPYDGYSRNPRTRDFVTGYNTSARPRSHERVPFDTLRNLIDAYDIAQIAIWHRIDAIRSLEWSLVAMDGWDHDISAAVNIGMSILESPDRENDFESWLSAYLFDILAFDAGTLYRMRNRAGQAIGLRVVDGSSIAPLQDYWGNVPTHPAEAYVQYVNGLPWNWLTTRDLVYKPFRKVARSPYGKAPLEAILLNANTDLRFQAFFLQHFCYDDQTEILTRNGWKRFPEVTGNEEYATLSGDGAFEWQASKDGKLHVFDSGGTMVQFRNRDVDLLVTPNHRMLTRRKSHGKGVLKTARDWEHKWHIRRADEFLGRCTTDWRLPLTSKWTAPEVPPERFTLEVPATGGHGATTVVDMPMWAFARFLGVFIAEGHLRHTAPGKVARWEINVSQLAAGKLDEVRRVLKDTGLSWSYWSDDKTGRFSVGCKALWSYLEQCGRGAPNKVLPDEVLNWPAELLEHLIYGLMIGDGHVNPSGLPLYVTTSRRLADQVQEIWQKCGTYSSIAVRTPHPTSRGKLTQYHVRARRDVEFQMPKPDAVPYGGKVYCVAVPNGIVLVRRNGKTMWCGNTEGNIPQAFASAPETWTPQQIEQFQGYWDGFILGDQAAKAQIKWIPGGSKIEFTQDREFSDAFSLHLLRKTFAAYHVVPSDAGFTQEINKSSGETQSDVQHRIGDVPLAKHVGRILTSFLQRDLHLPLKFQFDFGEEQDDRFQTAQADRQYWEMGVIGSSELRQLRYGLAEDDGYTVPRVIFATRSGPIPLSALDAVAGEINPGTAAPAANATQSRQAFRPVQGVIPIPPIEAPPLAVQEFGPAALPPAPPRPQPATAPVGKEGGVPTVGITAATGIYGHDGPGQRPAMQTHSDAEDDDARDVETTVTKAADAEIAAFRRHAKQTRRPGRKWRDFQFADVVDPVTAHRLNDGGRLAWRKAAGQTAVAGLAVRAEDTGRVLMLQRTLDPEDPAAGMWEMPGGHIEQGETPQQAAIREWSEETGMLLPDGQITGTWTSGIYQGFVYTVPSEHDVPIGGDRDDVDDPDGDYFQALAWWNPEQLPGNPAVRTELAADIDQVLDALTTEVVKTAAPKGDAPAKGAAHWPGWEHDHRAASHWSPKVAAATASTLTASAATTIAAGYLAAHPEAQDDDADRKVLIAAAAAHLAIQHLDLERLLGETITGLLTDGYLIGAASAIAVVDNTRMDLGGWEPGDTTTANNMIDALGQAASLGALLGTVQAAVRHMAATRLDDLAKAMADAAMRGDSSTAAGQAMRDALADASRAAAVAVTEVTRASSTAAMFTYAQRGITLGRWITEGDRKVCPRCIGNAAQGPVPIGQPYRSGDVQPPVHPHDRCAVLPA